MNPIFIPQCTQIIQFMSTPNLFQFAKSELSQDAFICWLLSWSKPEMETKNSALHQVSQDFVGALLQKHGRERGGDQPAVSEVHHQYKRADVVAELSDDTALLIEDKVGASAHSNQLERYLSALKEDFGEVLPIFLKTKDQSDYEHARQCGYEPFLRKDLLDVLRRGVEGGVESDIFHDYRRHLESIQEKVESFESVPVDQWPNAAWKGFYQSLQEQLGEGSWSYVPNPSGGFLAFYWHYFGSGGSEQYLQLEEEKLCFKISVDEEDRYSELRDKWHGRVVEAGEGASVRVRKPDRFGHGEHMTVAILEGGYIETDEDGLIDIDETIARLRKAEEILTQAVTDG